MKKHIIILLILATAVPCLKAQEISDDLEYRKKSSQKIAEPNIIKVDILGYVWGTIPLSSEYGVSYERLLSSKTSAYIKPSFLAFNMPLTMAHLRDSGSINTGIVIKGAAISGGFKYYFTGEAPEGFSISPYVSYAFGKLYDSSNPAENVVHPRKLVLAAMGGYQYEWDVFYMEFQVGLGIKFRNWKYVAEQPQSGSGFVSKSWGVEMAPSKTLAIPMHVNVGYRF